MLTDQWLKFNLNKQSLFKSDDVIISRVVSSGLSLQTAEVSTLTSEGQSILERSYVKLL